MLKSNARAIALATTAIALFTAVGQAAPPTPNLVLDPSFEATTLAGDPWSGSFNFIGGFARTGSDSLRSGCVAGPCFSSQAINLQPGIYRIEFYEGMNGGTPNQYSAQLGAADPITVNNSLNTASYGYHSKLVAASGGPTAFTLGIQQVPGFGSIDDVGVFLVDDGFGNNIGAASQTVALQASLDFIERIQDRFGRSGSAMEIASAGEVKVADASGGGYYSRSNGKYRAFMEVFGGHGEWDDSNTVANRRGITAGVEFAAYDTVALGAAVTVGASDYKTETLFTRNRGDADEFLGAIYANWSPRSTPLYISAIAGYGESDNDLKRTSLLGLGTVIAPDVNASQWFASAEIGFDWNMTSVLKLTPFARIDAAWLSQDGYAEVQTAGSTLVPAVVGSQDADALRSALGARLAFNVGSAEVKAKAAWAHNFEQDRFVTFSETAGNVTFVGASGAGRPDEDSALVGASVEFPIARGAHVYAAYNGDIGSTQEIHTAEAGLRITW